MQKGLIQTNYVHVLSVTALHSICKKKKTKTRSCSCPKSSAVCANSRHVCRHLSSHEVNTVIRVLLRGARPLLLYYTHSLACNCFFSGSRGQEPVDWHGAACQARARCAAYSLACGRQDWKQMGGQSVPRSTAPDALREDDT